MCIKYNLQLEFNVQYYMLLTICSYISTGEGMFNFNIRELSKFYQMASLYWCIVVFKEATIILRFGSSHPCAISVSKTTCNSNIKQQFF